MYINYHNYNEEQKIQNHTCNMNTAKNEENIHIGIFLIKRPEQNYCQRCRMSKNNSINIFKFQSI